MTIDTDSAAARRLVHPALDTAPEHRLAAADPSSPRRLTDRGRVGLLLQGAALLAHFDAAGVRPAHGWRGAGVGPDGELCGLAPVPGRRRILCQESLVELVAVLFGAVDPMADGLPGRGAGRRAVRRLLERWRPALTPLPPHRAVTEVLEVAPFLWDAAHAADRRALVAELVRNGSRSILLAGSGAGGWPRVVAPRDAEALREVLAGSEARSLWRDSEQADPARLVSEGRWRAAVAAWAIHGLDGPAGPEGPDGLKQRLAHGETLLADGRFAAAAEVLRDLARAKPASGSPAREEIRGRALAGCLRARLLLGELGAVRRRLGRLASDHRLPAPAVIELADIAQRACFNSRRPERAAAWVERALRAAVGADPPTAARAELVAAAAAWDRGDREAMDRHLAAARPEAEGSPAVAWRWHQAAGLRAMTAGDGLAVARHLTCALGTARRSLRRDQAGGLWSDLGVGRARLGDLAGAERAFLHAQRLLGACDGPRRTTLALHNLAEIRLRRGRVSGVADILARALEENRLSGNVRGQIHDLALLARHELVLGRAEAALSCCAEAAQLQEGVRGWYRDGVRVLEARALGWLGRAEAAREALSEVGPEALAELEPEERPAVFALAGLRDAAARALTGGMAPPEALAALWRVALDGGAAPGALWRSLTDLEPYRAARTVYDLERVSPGIAPAAWRRRAVAALRRVGATAPAERLELSDGGAWLALARYLSRAPRGLPELRGLFEDAGYPEARLERCGDDRPVGPEILIGGEGGDEELSAPLDDGELRETARLRLRVAEVDATVRALFALAVREIGGGTGGPAADVEGAAQAPAGAAAARSGIVGESPALRAAVERARRLAAGDLPLLITGESGTGKELVARLVHRESGRRGGELVAVNCAALSANLLLSDLFGHVRGAFTGADRDRAGVFESARGGTVFLDEIGDLPLAAQGTLLRVLQEGEVRRLGESLPRVVDARLVAATHRDLTAMVEEGSFRRDLFFRLSVARVELPPLRERDGDTLRIAETVLADLAPGARLSAGARGLLAAHPWPGNVRELRNVLEVAVALAPTRDGCAVETIGPEHLELAPTPGGGEPSAPTGDFQGRTEALQRRLVCGAIEASGGNHAEAARRLGLTRQGLAYQVKKLRLT